MLKLLKVLPLVALAACQTTGAPTESTRPQDAGVAPASAEAAPASVEVVSANTFFDRGISACADFLSNQKSLSSVEQQGFNKRLFGSWGSKPNWSISTLTSPDVTVHGTKGKYCNVNVSPQRLGKLNEYFGRAENALIAKGYKKELRPFGRSGQSTHFRKGSTEFQLTARGRDTFLTVELTPAK